MVVLQTYGGQGVECVSLNVIGPVNLLGSGTTRRCGFVWGYYDLVGGSVLIWGWALGFLYLGYHPVCDSQLLLQDHISLHATILPAKVQKWTDPLNCKQATIIFLL